LCLQFKMNRLKVTIFTDPMPWGREFLHEGMRRIARAIRNTLWYNRAYFNHPKYRGHFAVTRSLVEGLQKLNASFNYNPRYPWQIADTVIVLAGVRTLRQAIRLKQQGRIKKLYAGPNIVTFSHEYNFLVGSPEIDNYIVNSNWTLNLYEDDCPSLRGRCFIWPAGVDTNYWQPDSARKSNRILIFDKRKEEDDPARVKPYADYLRSAGWQVDVLVRCGAHGYSQDQYRNLLQGSCLMLGFTVGSESQGLAWAEAWACNVPTLIFRNTLNTYHGRKFACSTAPFLTHATGLFFDDLNHFKIQFEFWQAHRKEFYPRSWVLKNMSDEVSARLLYRHVTGGEV
jgi:hypothetical protein